MENYKRTEILGQGAYGKVYKGQDLRTGQIVALKKALASTEEEGIPPTSLREISILKSISECEFIVKLLLIVLPIISLQRQLQHQKIYYEMVCNQQMFILLEM